MPKGRNPSRHGLVLLALWVFLLPLPSPAQVSTNDVSSEGDCSPIVVGTSGDVTVNKDCPSPFSKEELEQLRDAIARLTAAGEWLEGSPNPLQDRDERLSGPIGISREELADFLRILKRREGSAEKGTGWPDRELATGDLSTHGDCSPIVVGTSGDVNIDITCRLPLSPKELAQLKETAGKLTEASERLAELPDHLRERYERLSSQFGVTQSALATFFRILNEEDVPVEELDAKLREIARRHRQLLIRVAELDAVDEQVARLRDKAKAAIERGDYDAADAFLKEAQKAQDAVLAQAEQPFLVAAELRARRADLRITRFAYEEAAELYLKAAEMVPGTRPLTEAAYLVRASFALKDAALFDLALAPGRRALAIREARLDEDDPDVAETLNLLAMIYQSLGQYGEAESLHKRALAIYEAKLGSEHPLVAVVLHNLGNLYYRLGRYGEAEPLYKRALKIWEKNPGEDNPEFALRLNALALLYKAQGRYQEAERLHKRALRIREARLGKDHPDVAETLNNLALVYRAEGRNKDAGRLLERALMIIESSLGKDHPYLAAILNNLAWVYSDQGRYEEAESALKRALAIRKAKLGQDHLQVAVTTANLAGFYYERDRYEEAEVLFKRALAIMEASVGKDHPNVAVALHNLGNLYYTQGRYEEAERLLKRALRIFEAKLGKDHPETRKVQQELEILRKIMEADKG